MYYKWFNAEHPNSYVTIEHLGSTYSEFTKLYVVQIKILSLANWYGHDLDVEFKVGTLRSFCFTHNIDIHRNFALLCDPNDILKAML